jgi:hypothetical protein
VPATTPRAPASTDLPVLYVTSVEILRASAEPELDIVRVTGLVASAGWSEPELVPTYAGKPYDGILDLELIATLPDESQDADGFVQVSAILPLDQGQPFKGVRVRGSEDAIAVKQIPGSSQVTISGRRLRELSWEEIRRRRQHAAIATSYCPPGRSPKAASRGQSI